LTTVRKTYSRWGRWKFTSWISIKNFTYLVYWTKKSVSWFSKHRKLCTNSIWTGASLRYFFPAVTDIKIKYQNNNLETDIQFAVSQGVKLW